MIQQIADVFARLRGWSRDIRGVSAIEFALILPVMITFYFGSVEITQLLTIDRKVTKAASSIADLVAQSTALNTGEINDLFQISTSLLQPFNAAGLQVVLTSVVADVNNNTTVEWSDALNAAPRTVGATVTLPQGLTDPNTSVIMVEVAYTYTSVIGEFVTGGVTMNDTFYLMPRDTDKVQRL